MAWNPPPSGPPPYYGYPPPSSATPGFAYVPTPVMMPVYPPEQINLQPAYIYPPPPVPDPVVVVDAPEPPPDVIHWVPSDPSSARNLKEMALVVGREAWDGSPLWAIRSHHSGHLIPGKLAIKHKAAYVPYYGKEVPVHNFEVLCAPSHAVHWLPASNGDIPTSAIIAGNTDTGEPLFLGRTRHKGSVTPGKVQGSSGGIFISFAGKEISYQQYEVLCRMDGY
ncbi:unnamed protein product [Euphydryas editha]|uniref:Uncharacterized protein n=1 Tax=Euphydryas editha TaxID=104508 RepID=A0AAU9TFB5_EUPED|nr:unnamed protein product [Euphydryas editha]